MSTANGFELAGRQLKVNKLLGAAARIERETGATRQQHVAFWRAANEQEWASLAVLAAVRPLSPITRQAFLDAMSERAGVI